MAYTTISGLFKGITDAIRTKDGTTAKIKHQDIPSRIGAIETGNPNITDDLITKNQINQSTANYLQGSQVYTADDYTSTVMTSYDGVVADDPLGVEITANQAGTLFIVDEVTGQGWSESISKGKVTIYNTMIGNPCRWWITDSSGAAVQSGRIKLTGNLRMIYLDGAHNFRDIGGWACDGGKIKYGKIIRGSRLDNASGMFASEMDMRRLREQIRIRADLDLRKASESTNNPLYLNSSPLGKDVEYQRIEVAEYAYTYMLNASGRAKTVQALEMAMSCAVRDVPIYIHCTAGADRTGTLCCILEALLGVSQTDCDRDYELTSFTTGSGAPARYRTSYGWTTQTSMFNTFTGNTFRDKVLAWAVQAGLDLDLINQYRHAMIDGTATDLEYGHSVTNNLTNATSNNSATKVVDGHSYTATILAISGYELSSVKVMMGGVDITSSAYSDGVINITSVTGDIVITVVATEVVTKINQLPISTDASGAIYNGKGWKSGVRITTSGSESSMAGYATTGFIPVEFSDYVELEGLEFNSSDTSGQWRIGFYGSNRENIGYDATYSFLLSFSSKNEVEIDGNDIVKFRLNSWLRASGSDTGELTDVKYIRLTCGDSITSDSAIYITKS